MDIKQLNPRPAIKGNPKLEAAYGQLDRLLSEIRKRKLSDEVIQAINTAIEELNAIPDSDNKLKAKIKKTQDQVVKVLENKHKFVAKNHYRNLWMILGMSAFGLPFGVALGTSLGNMAFLGIGLPIGMAVGLAVGAQMDKKAKEEGRQLDLELK